MHHSQRQEHTQRKLCLQERRAHEEEEDEVWNEKRAPAMLVA
jgi:hypothetical protein